MNAKPFTFATEFSPDGKVLSGVDATYVAKEQAEHMCAEARVEADAAARAGEETRAADALTAIAAHLKPVSPALSEVATQLKREAVELALAAAKVIAGKALDEKGAQSAAEAVGDVVANLKSAPSVVVTVADGASEPVNMRLEALSREGFEGRFTIKEDAAAKPGDWRVEWSDGAVEFNRDAAAEEVEAALSRRMNDPVEPQLDLFAGAAA